MNTDQVDPAEVLREFIADVESAYGSGDELDRDELSSEWPDLLVTYDHAVACLEMLSASAESVPAGREILVIVDGGLVQDIDGIPRDVIVRVRDYDVDDADDAELQRDRDGHRCCEAVWTHEASYQDEKAGASVDPAEQADLAEQPVPAKGAGDDMEPVAPPDDSGRPETPPNAWIIVDTDERNVAPCVYDDYEACAADANRMDDSLIVGLTLPDRSTENQEEQPHE